MTKIDAENIIDTITQLSSTAERILDSEDIQPEKAFSGVKHYLGNYYGATRRRLWMNDWLIDSV